MRTVSVSFASFTSFASPRITRVRAKLAVLAILTSLGSLAACGTHEGSTRAVASPASPSLRDAANGAANGAGNGVARLPLSALPTRPVVVAAAPATSAGLSLAPVPEPQTSLPISPLLAKGLPEDGAMQLAGVDGVDGMPATPRPAVGGACPAEMALVDGEYCTDVEQTCIDWMEPPQPGGIGRCAKFAPSVCKGQRVHMKFCIDVDEYTPPGETLPENDTSWTTATEQCGKIGKRLCEESEWNFACEGEDMLPYPTGYDRAPDKCNYDQMHLYDARGAVKDLRKPSASLTECTSPFGVRNMAGNVDEWTNRDVTWGEYKNAMKGGWWMAARNRCRPATISHWDLYSDFQTGFRCCEDAKQ